MKQKWYEPYIDRDDMWYGMLANLARTARQVVELGAERGFSTGTISKSLPFGGKVYSVDIKEDWSELPLVDPNWEKKVVKIVSSDLDPNIFKGVDLKKTDVWEIDSEHTYDHLVRTWDLYEPHFKKGALLAIDDLNLSQVMMWFEQVMCPKWDNGRVGLILYDK